MGKSGIKTIEYGTDKCWIYPIVDGVHTVGFRQLGMRAFSREVAQEDTILYADNSAYITVPGSKTVTGEITYYKINDEFWELLGWEINETNGVISDSGKKTPFGMAFITQEVDSNGVNDPRLIVCPYFYGTEPSRDKATLEDTVDGEELVVAYTASEMDDFVSAEGNKLTMFIVTLEGWTLAEAETLLEGGIPMPTDDFTSPTTVQATGSLTVGTPTDIEIPFTYDYAANDEMIAQSNITITTSADTSTVVDTISPLVEGIGTADTFTSLTAETEYVVTMFQGTRVLNSFTISTTA